MDRIDRSTIRSAACTRLLRQRVSLTTQQHSQHVAALRPAIGLDSVCEAIDGARQVPLCCPDCATAVTTDVVSITACSATAAAPADASSA